MSERNACLKVPVEETNTVYIQYASFTVSHAILLVKNRWDPPRPNVVSAVRIFNSFKLFKSIL